MKKLILLIGFLIVFISGYSQTSVLRPRIDADLLNGQLSTYYLDTSSLAQTKAGQLTLGGDLVLQSAAIIDNADISDVDRDKITGYLANKWSITATTDFKGYVLRQD